MTQDVGEDVPILRQAALQPVQARALHPQSALRRRELRLPGVELALRVVEAALHDRDGLLGARLERAELLGGGREALLLVAGTVDLVPQRAGVLGARRGYRERAGGGERDGEERDDGARPSRDGKPGVHCGCRRAEA